MLVRLDVEVLAAHRAEPRTVGSAEDLIRELECDRVARPGADIQMIANDVVGVELVRGRRVGVVELARGDLAIDLGEAEAAHAGAGQVQAEPEIEHRRSRRLRDLQLDGNRRGDGLVALTAEHERLDLDVERLLPHFPRPEPERPQIDGGHRVSVAGRSDFST
jgi:hypothetical protein